MTENELIEKMKDTSEEDIKLTIKFVKKWVKENNQPIEKCPFIQPYITEIYNKY